MTGTKPYTNVVQLNQKELQTPRAQYNMARSLLESGEAQLSLNCNLHPAANCGVNWLLLYDRESVLIHSRYNSLQLLQSLLQVYVSFF